MIKPALKIALAADHGGYRQAVKLKVQLLARGYAVVDLLPARLDRNDDFPISARRAARLLKNGRVNRAILICRTGTGMAMAANRFPGIRAVQGTDRHIIRRSRQEENSNVLALAADYLSSAKINDLAIHWLTTTFIRRARYQRRLKLLDRDDYVA